MVPDCELVYLISDLFVCFSVFFTSYKWPIMTNSELVFAEDPWYFKSCGTFNFSNQVDLRCVRA